MHILIEKEPNTLKRKEIKRTTTLMKMTTRPPPK